jgi:hypothetical protein
MKINATIFEKVIDKKAMLCVVTKYFDRGETLEIIAELEKYKDIIY